MFKIAYSRRVLVIFVLLALVLMGGFQYFYIRRSLDALRSSTISSARDNVSRANMLIDQYAISVEGLLRSLALRDDIADLTHEEACALLDAAHEQNASLIRNIYLFREGQPTASNRALYFELIGNPPLEQLIAGGGITGHIDWSEPYFSSLSSDTVCVYMFVDEYTALALEMNLTTLSEGMNSLLTGDGSTFFIADSEGHAFMFEHSYDKLPIQRGVYPMQLESDFVAGALDQLKTGQPSNGSYVVGSSANTLGWKVVTILLSDVFLRNMTSFYATICLSFVVFIALVAVFAPIASFISTKPLRQLAERMESVKRMDDLTELYVEGEDEVARLVKSYNAQVRSIRRLVEELREVDERRRLSELRMLQSQIGPHFLYNTLACVGSLARQGKSEEAGNAISKLTNLLSLSFYKHGELSTVAQELEGLDCYIDIQRIRYGDAFDYEVRISDDAWECVTPKLLLQPLVENSIFHGLLPAGRRGRILVACYVARGRLRLYVFDDGVGMDAVRALDDAPPERTLNDRFSNIGISNVNERLVLRYGPGSALRIRSKRSVGTVVRIELPADELPL